MQFLGVNCEQSCIRPNHFHFRLQQDSFSCHQKDGVSSESRVLVLFLSLWQTLYKISDHEILVILQFFRLFLTMIGNVAKVDVLVKFARSLPQTLYLAKSYIGLSLRNLLLVQSAVHYTT